jgi:hypothetical protein
VAETAQQIARWAEKQAKPVHTPKYRRLTNSDLALILKLDSEGLTQVQIAQRLDCDQGTISRWLSQCSDSTKEASAYLRGSALGMARKIVTKGRASDLVATLKGINVLEEQQVREISVTINGVMLPGMGLGASQPQLEPSITLSPDSIKHLPE